MKGFIIILYIIYSYIKIVRWDGNKIYIDLKEMRNGRVKWEKIKGTKAQSRMQTSDFKLERPVP